MKTIGVAFVDWDTARRAAGVRTDNPQRDLQKAFDGLQQQLTDALTPHVGAKQILSLRLRLYHGWHQGKTPTADHRQVLDFRTRFKGTTVGRVRVEPDYEIADHLLCRGQRAFLYDTVRSRPGTGLAQKLVDTALVADLLQFAREDRASHRDGFAIVVSDDDDMFPGIFTAERWGCRVCVLRLENKPSKALSTDGLLIGRLAS